MMIKRLRDLREDNELTQRELAEVLNVDRSTYGGWEIAKDTIPLIKLNQVANYYNVSMDYLLGLSDIKSYNFINKEIDITIVASRLKQFRENNNLLQKDFVELLNTTSSTYSAYESGKVLISTSSIYAIANKYKGSVDWLLGRID